MPPPLLPLPLLPLPLPVLLLPGIIEETDEPMLLAFSRTCSTTRLIALRTAGVAAAPAAAAPAAASAVRVMRVRRAFLPRDDDDDFLDDFLAAPRREAVAFPPFRPAAERRADFDDFDDFFEPELFFDPPRFFDEERRDDERFFEVFLDELFFDPPFFEDFFDDLREELFLDAAMVRLLLRLSVRCPLPGSGSRCAQQWCTRCSETM